jgi:SAM-dependent methyltransferase
MTTVQQLYGELWADENGLDSELQRSLDPRGTDWLFAAFAELEPKPGQLLVDIGSRDAVHAIRLVREHGLKAIALDPVPLHAELARRAVTEAGLENEVKIVEAAIEAMPLADASADWIWSRDVLVHVDLAHGLAECARVLRPGGRMLAYVTCATDSLEPREAGELFEALAIVRESVQPTAIESRATAAGFALVSKTLLGGEWRERMIEDASWDPSDDLLRLSRLHRRESELLERHGATRVAAYAGARRWGVYQLLGKLCPTIYIWQRDA